MKLAFELGFVEIALEEWTPRGPFSCADFFFAEMQPWPRLLLIDGTGIPALEDGRPPRVRFAQVIRRAWAGMRDAPADTALALLGETLRTAGSSEDGTALFASAALCARRAGVAEWEVAEAGDTRVFLGEQLVHSFPLAPEEHRVSGQLGTDEPAIRMDIVRPEAGAEFSLLTDGAWRLLVARGRLGPRASRLSRDTFEDFSRWKYDADDDATFARCALRHP